MKILSIYVYTLSIRVFGWVTLAAGLISDYHYLFHVLVVMLVLPEIGFAVSRGFRSWLKSGIEDGDGVFNTKDFNQMLVHYSTLWCVRLFVLFGLLEAFYGVQVREIFIGGSLAGAFGIETVSFFARKKEK